MTSEPPPAGRRQLYVWMWLPGDRDPVVAGVLARAGGRFQGKEVLTYTYARSYRDRADAISLFTPELPLRVGTFDPTAPSRMPDAAEPTGQSASPFARVRRRSPLEDGGRHLIAKFSSTTDTRPVVKAEAVAMLLAARAGITVAPVEVRDVDGRAVLLVERFDRTPQYTRRAMVSALTILGLDELESRHSSYAELAEAVRLGPWVEPAATLRELYTRLVFNVCVGNNDDHLRNHAAFWDGSRLMLTPAYDLAPSPRSTSVSSQAIGITRDGRRASQLWLCREVAPEFLLDATEADTIIENVVATIRTDWGEVCDEALATRAERDSLWQREFLNPYVFYGQP